MGESTGQGELQRIVAELRREYDGDPWHGASTRVILQGVTAEQAASRSLANAHTIWEIVLHLMAWTREVCRRLDGSPPQVPAEGDWPAATDTSEGAWSRARDALASAHEELLSRLGRFDESRLLEIQGSPGDASIGSGSLYVQLHGLAQHDAYHSGQIALLKKATAGVSAPPA